MWRTKSRLMPHIRLAKVELEICARRVRTPVLNYKLHDPQTDQAERHGERSHANHGGIVCLESLAAIVDDGLELQTLLAGTAPSARLRIRGNVVIDGVNNSIKLQDERLDGIGA